MNGDAQNKRGCTLITGGAGFIGSHLADELIERGDEVWVIDDLSTGSLDNIRHLLDHPRFHFVEGDVRDIVQIDHMALGTQTIYHLAAVVGVQNVLDDPLRVVEENIFGTRAVLEAARKARAKVYLASTSEIYGKNADVPFDEDADRVLGPTERGRWSYAASKAIDEVLTIGYCSQHGLEMVIGRFFNTIGQRQTGQYGMVVPRFVEAALAGEPLTIYGDGSQTRAFCDVRDSVRAIIGLMDDPSAKGRAYNIGSRREISIEQLAREVLEVLAPERRSDQDAVRHVSYEEAYGEVGRNYDEFPRRVPDITRLMEQIGWVPKYDLDETLRWIADDVCARAASGVAAAS